MAVLVIDVGSSSARALLFDDQAEPIPGASAVQHHHMTTAPAGAATMDAAQLQARVEQCVDTVLQHPAAREIQVVGLSTYVGNMLGVDERGNALTPIYSYAETRSADDVEALKKLLDGEVIHQQTGCLLHTAYQPGRLRWLRRTEPDLFAKVSQWVDFATYFYNHWFGTSPASYSAASWSGMLNRRELAWDKDILKALDLTAEHFPQLADYNSFRHGLTPAYAQRWPALRDVPFCLAVGDGAAANIGSGCADSAHIALTVGTTAALRIVSDAYSSRLCSICFNNTVNDPCLICSDPKRDHHKIMVVETPVDVQAFEHDGSYDGVYHVLHGAISPVKGIGPDNIRFRHLVKRVEQGSVLEIIIATNSGFEGDATAEFIRRELASKGAKVTRLTRMKPVSTASSELSEVVPDGLWSYRVDAAHHLIGGATSEGGSIFQWAKDTLRLPDHDAIESELAKREPDSHGLTFLPLLAGERSPGWAAHATGSIAGLRLSTTPLDILQAALEGVALRLSLIADQLTPLTGNEASVIAGGGALVASPAWTQMIADALNRPLHITEETEITARGAAILALHAIGKGSLLAHPPTIARVVEPVSAHVSILRAARQRQIELYRKTV